jgi:hypothetical protein
MNDRFLHRPNMSITVGQGVIRLLQFSGLLSTDNRNVSLLFLFSLATQPHFIFRNYNFLIGMRWWMSISRQKLS